MGNGTESVSGLKSYLVDGAILFFQRAAERSGAYSRTAAVVGSGAVMSEQRNKYAIIADHRLAGSLDVAYMVDATQAPPWVLS